MVTDLFEDIKDGVILLALLEVLSGQKLVSFTLKFEREQSNERIFGLHQFIPLPKLVPDDFAELWLQCTACEASSADIGRGSLIGLYWGV